MAWAASVLGHPAEVEEEPLGVAIDEQGGDGDDVQVEGDAVEPGEETGAVGTGVEPAQFFTQ
ncbi:hypothetical protein HUW62_29815 [Myxococcus sp. AM011]|uniref:hypothetical protein n=1 Tax=Myxococcus sp. AM011 TaxID=2745200 RepID=UPI001595F399|nr:hypothetical protein [Myxococcus sp. AM011]NVJ25430.1 hypothetical protein [Myxococcus sp. AM011]